jgi:hypothetical protein
MGNSMTQSNKSKLENDGFKVVETITATLEGTQEVVNSAISKADEKYTGVVNVNLDRVKDDYYKGTVTVIR